MKSIVLFIVIVTMFKCNQIDHKLPLTNKQIVSIPNNVIADTIKSVIGLVKVVSESEMPLHILNNKGDIIQTLTFKKASSFKRIKPYAFHFDNNLLIFSCLNKDNSFVKILINEDKNEIGYIKTDNKIFVFETWREHILNSFSIEGKNNNPLRKNPNNQADIIAWDNDEFYHPESIENEWVKVKYGSTKQWYYAWLRWKDANKILINIFYF